jgi:hypothetical protein
MLAADKKPSKQHTCAADEAAEPGVQLKGLSRQFFKAHGACHTFVTTITTHPRPPQRQ